MYRCALYKVGTTLLKHIIIEASYPCPVSPFDEATVHRLSGIGTTVIKHEFELDATF